MVNQIKVAAIQMISGKDWKKNIATAEVLIAKAKESGASLVILPEFFIRISNDHGDEFKSLIEELGQGKIQDLLSQIAHKYSIYLVAGTIPIKSSSSEKCYNTLIVYDPQGKMICHYHKIHLFKLMHETKSCDESDTFTDGSEVVTFRIGELNFGLAVCYDLRFPELFRKMGEVDAIIIPSAFLHHTGQYHWEILLRARAIENLCYVIAPNQGGVHQDGNRHTFGHTMIINPWGEINAIIESGDGVISGIINKSEIIQIRSTLPALSHKKI